MVDLVKHKDADKEDLHALLAKSQGDQALVKDLSAKILAGYLNLLRDEFQTNEEVKDIIAEAKPAVSCVDVVKSRLKNLAVIDSVSIFEEAVLYLLTEIDEFRQLTPGLYIVDKETGKAITQYGPDAVFQPPDYIGEDGKLHKSQLVVHPKITSAIVKSRVEQHRLQRIAAQVKNNPAAAASFAHITEPHKLITKLKTRLETSGVEVELVDSGFSEYLEFGRENINDIFQAPNIMFHRLQSWTNSLFKRITAMNPDKQKIGLGQMSEHKGNKQTWFTVGVRIG